MTRPRLRQHQALPQHLQHVRHPQHHHQALHQHQALIVVRLTLVGQCARYRSRCISWTATPKTRPRFLFFHQVRLLALMMWVLVVIWVLVTLDLVTLYLLARTLMVLVRLICLRALMLLVLILHHRALVPLAHQLRRAPLERRWGSTGRCTRPFSPTRLWCGITHTGWKMA